MKKTWNLPIFFLLNIVLANYGHSQSPVRKIDLYIVPIFTSFRVNIPPKKVKKHATMKVIIKESSYKLDNNEFYDLIKGLDESNRIDTIANVYRIVCVVHKIFGKEVLYFNRFGDFLYKEKAYKNEQIKLFVFNHLPESVKTLPSK